MSSTVKTFEQHVAITGAPYLQVVRGVDNVVVACVSSPCLISFGVIGSRLLFSKWCPAARPDASFNASIPGTIAPVLGDADAPRPH